MKKSIKVLLIGSMLWLANAFAADECFFVFDLNSQKIIKQQGNICNTRFTPASTFKIALSLMGYDSKILKNTKIPEWPYNSDYHALSPAWQTAHNPKSWIKDSCVWYSKVLTQKLGAKKFKHYVKFIHYGNEDLSGDPGKNNGLTNAWLSSSLKISAQEQSLFLENMLNKKFTLSNLSYDMTKQILFIEKLNNGWNLYGKTGTGFVPNENDPLNSQQIIAWFIGWATKDDRTIIFVKNSLGKNIQPQQPKNSIKQLILTDKAFAK